MMKERLCNLLSDDSGQDLVEYALLGALAALSIMAAMHKFDTKLTKEYTKVGKSL